MVKSKKMSKTSIAVVVLALLLVLSLCLGITGAWFTSNLGPTGNSVELRFGNVTYTELAAGTTVKKSGTVDGDVVNNPYLLVAGTEIETTVSFQNNSTVDTYYALEQNGHLYVINADGNRLLEVVKSNASAGNQVLASAAFAVDGLGYLEVGDEASINQGYRLILGAQAADANNGRTATALSAAFVRGTYVAATDAVIGNGTEQNPETPAVPAHFTYDDTQNVIDITQIQGFECKLNSVDKTVITYDADLDLGILLMNGEFQLVAIQAQNIAGNDAFDELLLAKKTA